MSFSHFQRKAIWSEEKLFYPNPKSKPKAAFHLLSLICSFNVLVSRSHLPAVPHIHKQNLHLQEFFSPCHALGWRWLFTEYNTRVSFRNLNHFLWTHNILWNKMLFGSEEKHPLVCTAVCQSSVSWPQTAATAAGLMPGMRDPHGRRDTTDVGAFTGSEELSQGWLPAHLLPLCCCWGRKKADSQRAPASLPTGTEAQPRPRSKLSVRSCWDPSPAQPARAERGSRGCSFPRATTRAGRGIRTHPTTPCSYQQQQQATQHSFWRDGSGGESMMRNKDKTIKVKVLLL